MAAAQKAAFWKPSVAEVVAAAKSLYDDELKPYGRILLKRLRERRAAAEAVARATGCSGERESRQGLSAAAFEAVPLIDPKYLRRCCEACSTFTVEPAEGREYAVLLAGQPGIFVDACSPLDPYPAQLWAEVAAYFEAFEEGAGGRLPCGRYACAQELRARGAAFLGGRSLGEACHIVQLAISHKKVLGHSEGHLVPYSRSEECAKGRCAVRQQPLASPHRTAPSRPFATWEDVRSGLRQILEASVNPAPGVVTLSNVKRLFHSQLQLELSETVLGHYKVCELLQDARLRDVCSVHALGNGQSYVQLVEPLAAASPAVRCAGEPCAASPSHGMVVLSTCASNRHVPLMTAPVPRAAAAAAVAPPLLSTTVVHPAGKDTPFGCKPREWEGSTALGSPLGSALLSVSTCSVGDELETDSCVSAWAPNLSVDLSGDSVEGCAGAGAAEDGEAAPLPPLPLALSCEGFIVRNTFIDMEPPTPVRRRAHSVPRGGRLG